VEFIGSTGTTKRKKKKDREETMQKIDANR
jgi:hypothetical protein